MFGTKTQTDCYDSDNSGTNGDNNGDNNVNKYGGIDYVFVYVFFQ